MDPIVEDFVRTCLTNCASVFAVIYAFLDAVAVRFVIYTCVLCCAIAVFCCESGS